MTEEPIKEPVKVGRFDWERELRDRPDIVGAQLLVLLTLGTHVDKKLGTARPSQATLASQTGLHVRTVRRHLAAAVAQGLLKQEQRGHRLGDGTAVASEYQPTIPTSTGQGTPVEDDLNRTGDAGRADSQPDTGGAQPDTGGTSTGPGGPPFSAVHEDHLHLREPNPEPAAATTPDDDDDQDDLDALVATVVEDLLARHGHRVTAATKASPIGWLHTVRQDYLARYHDRILAAHAAGSDLSPTDIAAQVDELAQPAGADTTTRPRYCTTCSGTGEDFDQIHPKCPACDGTGRATPDTPDHEQRGAIA